VREPLKAFPLDPAVRAALEQRLAKGVSAPIAVAFSGGGDSLALLLAAKSWADGAGRRLIALTVDHRLQPAGAAWAVWCAARAGRLGVDHRTLVWAEEKPAGGLARAARLARHRLLAGAAREVGAVVMLLGHTVDDIIEAQVMNRAGAAVAAPRDWSPAPVWPEGRGIFILRPLLSVRRAELRQALRAHGETWIEDPVNDDPRQPRARARRALAGGGVVQPTPDRPDLDPILAQTAIGAGGEAFVPIEAARLPGGLAFLTAALACVSGRETPPRAVRVRALLDRCLAPEDFAAALGGARLGQSSGVIVIAREAGDRRSRPPPTLELPAGLATVWDGRFAVRARAPGLVVRPLLGLAARLSADEKGRLRQTPPSARAALPAIVRDGQVACPVLQPMADLDLDGLVEGRLAGFCGRFESEESLLRVAKSKQTS
jgi:tRNA(Ile)-lysidine synthase